MILLENLLFIIFLLFILSWIFVALAVYFIPVVIAYVRRHNNILAVLVLNVFLGWTFFGWLAALLWSLNKDIKEDDLD